MASYPSIKFAFGSEETIKDGVIVDRAMVGTAKGRNLWTGKKRAYTVRHAQISTTDKNTLETFYNSNRTVTITFTWTDGTARTMILTGMRIMPGPNLSGGRLWDVDVTMEEA